MKYLLIAILFLVLLPGVKTSAKNPTFEETVTNMVQTHKIMGDRLMKMWEFRKSEVYLLAEIIFWENWFTDPEKRAAYLTGAVAMNRVKSDKWPNTVHDVAYQRGQYSTTKYFYTKEIPAECYDMAWDIYRNGTPDVPAGVVFQATFKQGPKYEVINGEWFCYG